MPMMLRINPKATKIAYKIMGVPANLRKPRSPEEKEIDRRLIVENTVRVK